MKLRTRTKAVLEPGKDIVRGRGKEISQFLPATKAITIDNAASPLLQLPQELKNIIYKHIVSSQQAIHVFHQPWEKRQFDRFPCYATSTDQEDEQIFHTAPEENNISLRSLATRHIYCRSNLDVDVMFDLDIAILLSCRQIYHETIYTIYATNTFSFGSPRSLRAFISTIGHGPATNNLAIRKIHLDIRIDLREDEYDWNKTLSLMVKKLPGLNNVSISIDQYPYWYGIADLRSFTDPAQGSNFFLRGILKLRELPLSGLILIVTDSGYSDDGSIEAAEHLATQWTHAQRVQWALFVKGAVLGST